MKTDQFSLDSLSSNVFLTGFILLANVNISDIAEYAIKAVIGGGIWLGYKVAAGYIEKKRGRKL
ncbi:hypothetical protein [Dinghuibacter silviterrae]|uniref:Uncharacterized protein n=1 Tax=Dinghuibacter silviterrae TaxID=1539049 RepID=A0A4R8DVN6_9BACT|nr:hypothetical protein [Dinghuibacter silviterrae]TDX01477.1 hypothetical protein EDB95_2513 [Dinghuibacter silviterrae]